MFDGIVFPVIFTRVSDMNVQTVSPTGRLCDVKQRRLEIHLLTAFMTIVASSHNMGALLVRTETVVPLALLQNRRGIILP